MANEGQISRQRQGTSKSYNFASKSQMEGQRWLISDSGTEELEERRKGREDPQGSCREAQGLIRWSSVLPSFRQFVVGTRPLPPLTNSESLGTLKPFRLIKEMPLKPHRYFILGTSGAVLCLESLLLAPASLAKLALD